MKDNRKEFLAVLMSGSFKKWFPTKKQAWDYIYSRSCEDCKKNRKFDMCSAEWSVWTKEEYEEYSKKKNK